jgi:glutathione S-transferase
MPKALELAAPSFCEWAQVVIREKSVTTIWDEDLVVRRTLERIAKANGAK